MCKSPQDLKKVKIMSQTDAAGAAAGGGGRGQAGGGGGVARRENYEEDQMKKIWSTTAWAELSSTTSCAACLSVSQRSHNRMGARAGRLRHHHEGRRRRAHGYVRNPSCSEPRVHKPSI